MACPHQAEAGGKKQQPQNDHAGAHKPNSGYRSAPQTAAGTKDTVQCQNRRSSAHCKGVVPVDIVDLRRIARPGVVGVVQRQQLGGRVGLQVKAPVQQAVRQRAVLLVDEADRALPVPERGVVIFVARPVLLGSQNGMTTTKAANTRPSTAAAARSQTLPASQRRCHNPLAGRRP